MVVGTIPAKDVGAVQYTGACKFCGQTMVVNMATDKADLKAIDEHATMMCDCDEAIKYQKVQGAKRKLDSMLEEVDEEAVEFANAAINLVGIGKINGVNINIENTKISISINNKGEIKIQKKTTSTKELKI